jgi:hypothetical protein
LRGLSSIDALGQIMQSNDKDIVKVSPKGYALSNGLNYCCVEIKSIDGANYLVQAYGNEAIELYEKAMIIMSYCKDKT